MKLRRMFSLALLICMSWPGYAEKQDQAALQGSWRAIEATSNGEPPPAGMLEKLTIVFSGDTMSIMGASPTPYTIDTNFVPAHIDILNSRHQVGIYELKGDTLKLCVGVDGDWPKAFHTEKHTDHTYMLLKRMK